jgi:hypothetical protein
MMSWADAPGVASLSPETQQMLTVLLARTHHSAGRAGDRDFNDWNCFSSIFNRLKKRHLVANAPGTPLAM